MQPQAPKMQQPEQKSVATTLEWRGIGIFLLVTFGLTWAVWAVVYLLGGSENLPLFTVGSLLAMWCPGIAAIICSRYITPMSKRDLGLQRGYLERYVSIYFFVFLFLIAAMGLSVGLGFQEVNATLEPLSSEIADQQYPFNDPILAVFISIVSVLYARGALQQRVRARRRTWLAWLPAGKARPDRARPREHTHRHHLGCVARSRHLHGT